ncbi:MAG: glutamine synthetase type III, partial [Eudoraea sp.]|nr:glutamine synthetase type III [Eudoraea sp.]
MSSQRLNAISLSAQRKAIAIVEETKRSELFGKHVFNEDRMTQYLTKDAFQSVKNAVFTGSKIDRKMADQIAESMKAWALSMGATHYTHWFQPLTGATAEKHDAFF